MRTSVFDFLEVYDSIYCDRIIELGAKCGLFSYQISLRIAWEIAQRFVEAYMREVEQGIGIILDAIEKIANTVCSLIRCPYDHEPKDLRRPSQSVWRWRWYQGFSMR